MHPRLREQMARAYGAEAPPGLVPLLALVEASYERADQEALEAARAIESARAECRALEDEVEREAAVRRIFERELGESEARFNAFMDHAPIAAALFDVRGRLLYANPGYRGSAAQLAPLVARRDGLPAGEGAGGREVFTTRDAAGVERRWIVCRFAFGPHPGERMVGLACLEIGEFGDEGADTMTPVDLNAELLAAIATSRAEWMHVAEVEADLDEALPAVPCLAAEVRRVFLSLIVHCAHAIGETLEKGGETGSIRISTRHDGEWAEVVIADTGSALSDALPPRRFDPGSSAPSAGKPAAQDLADCRRLVVEKHAGALEIESDGGRGTTFVVRLPLSQPRRQGRAA